MSAVQGNDNEAFGTNYHSLTKCVDFCVFFTCDWFRVFFSLFSDGTSYPSTPVSLTGVGKSKFVL